MKKFEEKEKFRKNLVLQKHTLSNNSESLSTSVIELISSLSFFERKRKFIRREKGRKNNLIPFQHSNSISIVHPERINSKTKGRKRKKKNCNTLVINFQSLKSRW